MMNHHRSSPVLLVLVMVVACVSLAACHPDEPEDVLLWSDELIAEDIYMFFDEWKRDLLLVVDEGIWRLDVGLYIDEEEDIHLEEVAKGLTTYRMASIPYVVPCDDAGRRITWVRERNTLQIREFTDDSAEAYVRDAAGDRYFAQVREAAFFTPVMFLEQYYRFTVDDRWFELSTTVQETDPGDGMYTCLMQLHMLAEDPEGPPVTTPGYAVSHVDGGLSVWVAEDWQDVLEWGDFAREAVDEAWEFVGLRQRLPIHVIAGPGADLVRGRTWSHYYHRYARASVQRQSVPILRHEIMHGAHNYALMKEGGLGRVPVWVRQGLAEYFGYLGSDLEDPLRLRTYQIHPFIPLDARQVLLERQGSLFYWSMIDYLVRELGRERVVEYSTVYRQYGGWHREDVLTGEYFGMTQEEILNTVLEDTPAVIAQYPRPDSVVSEWERLTGATEDNRGFALSPDGEILAVIAGGNADIRLLDLQTLEVRQVFSARDHEEMDVVGTFAWFPCGERLAFMGRVPRENDIYVLDLRDGSHERIIDSEAVDSGPDISPCGEKMAFRSQRTGHSEIYIKDLKTAEVTRLTEEETLLTWPVFSEDGSRLVFLADRRRMIGIMELDTGDISWLDLDPHAVVTTSRPRWLDDGRLILTVAPYGISVSPSLLRVDPSSGEHELLGGLDVALSWVEPASQEDQFYVHTWLWDPEVEAVHRGIARVTFEKQAD